MIINKTQEVNLTDENTSVSREEKKNPHILLEGLLATESQQVQSAPQILGTGETPKLNVKRCSGEGDTYPAYKRPLFKKG